MGRHIDGIEKLRNGTIGISDPAFEYPITVMTGILISVVYTQLRLPRQETIVMAKKKAASKKKTKKKAKKKR
jgi:hypothetical protein